MHHRPHDQGGLPPGVGLPPGGGLHPVGLHGEGGGGVWADSHPRIHGIPRDTVNKGRFNAFFFSKNTINTNDSKLFQLVLHDHLDVGKRISYAKPAEF